MHLLLHGLEFLDVGLWFFDRHITGTVRDTHYHGRHTLRGVDTLPILKLHFTTFGAEGHVLSAFIQVGHELVLTQERL